MRHAIKDIFSNRPSHTGREEDLYKVRKIPYKKDDLRILEDLLKSSRRLTHGGKKGSGDFHGGGIGGGGFENGREQRVMFKASYSYSQSVHEKYLRTYMPQENKSEVEEKPQLFGTPENEYGANMDGLHFKCIISPENQDVNLELLSREFIKRVEALTGYRLYWRGCVHTDTPHRHAHLCINGRDKDGKNVRFQKEMIRTTMRETLSYVTTLMVGERTDREIEASRQNMVSARRWTKLDEALERYSGKISTGGLPTDVASRLAFLSEIGLSEKHAGYYALKSGWKDVLVATGRYNTFIGEWQKAGGNLALYSGGTVRGICENVITFDKDEAWNDAVIVKEGGRRIYIPVWQLSKENLIGRQIEVSGGKRALSRQVRSSDIRLIDREQKPQGRSALRGE